jgi:hypothetical protein
VILCSHAIAQKKAIEWQVGYIAPYLVNVGGTTGVAIDINDFNNKKYCHRLQFLSQLGYFSQFNIAHNLLVNPEIVYKLNRTGKRLFLSSSFGFGYLLSFQKQDGTLNLGTGEIDYRYEALNYFLPTLNIGLGVDPKKHLGFYFKTTYGRKLSTQNANASFFAISAGLVLMFNSKK